MGDRLALDLSAPPPIPESSIAAAEAVLRSGWTHRYGETLGDASDAAMLEAEFAAHLGTRYCVAVNSCGSAMYLALLCTGVRPGDRVLMNAFTLAPVPGAVAHAGAEHVLVEVTQDLVIDLDDLARKARASGARHLLLSHMRGHIADMTRLMALCDDLGVTVIEDCAHTMGARWAGRPTGTFGKAGCFSLQAYKHVNAGEGGLIATDDPDIAARAILYSGSYMLYRQHRARPGEDVFARWKDVTPNYSLRMSNLVAAVARPQIALLAGRARIWNDRHGRLAALLGAIPGLRLPHRPQEEEFVQSSIQFAVAGLDADAFAHFLAGCRARGVYLKWFGSREAEGYTSVPGQWRYLADPHTPAATAAVLERLCDMRIPLTLAEADCATVARIVAEELAAARAP
ncbi:DegT/DnrJ/EryC1/StrS family aminotransferase [Neoroseomonas oryzicola]|uniref:Aminotransferase class I/II-fold pyridoxal phosphate-dependent enzyme n=1 Tax=Neoroseomonas oryzicola TaxID=535904 RepID=A0A9X9WPG1_9PROT|nr:aminotransferase class I/II-fold pyridoxal phosphate-dependent enzyme [Neoroseomonas oryzicola]MBR0662221.1 aminotransferase class I/II-fold pyridoxal phosphate-dependent enzyme [Neoroseomonas oryzicola]NKE16735.1 aminotransferase class I/II-fold pyridoxal phosphate-dependent enzyme [Neoroseomonas oryzicola]